MPNQYPKGSEWRRWDLQVHTPASVLNNGFGTDWDAYVRGLFTALIQKQIAAVGITDYFTIDGYKKIKQEYLANDAKLKTLFSDDDIEKIKRILVIPNVEFRSEVFVGPNSVNFHILFSEEVTIRDIEETFLHEINFLYQGEPQREDKKRKLREVNLIELGARLKGEHENFRPHTDLYVGMMNAVVDHKEISKILFDKKSIFGGKYLFAVAADEDLSAINWNSRDHLTRKVLIQKSDMLFSSNDRTRSWGLGKTPFTEGVRRFIGEFITLKPCVHGSDAHELPFIGHPCAKRGDAAHNCATSPENCDLRFCWIKADPTFEGFKQILYEPEDRIRIQDADPTPLKSSQTISTFSIKSATLEPELKFKKTVLPLNAAFVAITGGKGSGKTALVDLIANMYENRAYCEDKNSFARRISEGDNPRDLETTIKIQNDQELTKEIKNGSFMEGASIVYVAQGELEKHVEDPDRLESYINKLIFESNEVKDSELLFDYENINNEVADLNEGIDTCNSKIFTLENETTARIEEDLRKDAKTQTTKLEDAENKIKDLAKSLSAAKVKEAEEKQKQLTSLRDKKTQLTDLGISIKEALKFADEDVTSFNKQIAKINALAAKLSFADQFKSVEYSDAGHLRSFITTVRTELRKTIGEIETFQKELEEKEKGIKEHAKLLDKKKELEKEIKQIADKLKVVAEKKRDLKGEIKKRADLFESLLNKRLEQRGKYLGIIVAFSANKSDILNDLEFTAELVFDQGRFFETMSELVDLRKIRIKGITDADSEISFFSDAMEDLVASPTPEKVRVVATTKIEELLIKIVPNQKKAETLSRRTIYDSVFGDYLGVTPSVKYKKIKLSKLSLGQKATVLIKIYLAQGGNPMVIDSHDDHLDNEFIMEELVKAIRQAKQHRQIIIVSNNGNVVVNSDAEQVVIACRDDQGEISYNSGSLENPALRSKLLGVLEGGEEAFSKRQQKYRLQP
jgi:energy-coupling factor transporter ATP-binding protein EcfA2